MSPSPQELLDEARQYHQASQFKKGMKTAEKARKNARKEGDSAAAIEGLRIMADCALNAREMKKAKEYYEELIREAAPDTNAFYLSAASWGIGQIALHKMSYHEAISVFKQGLQYAESIADQWYTAWNSFSLGNAQRGIGNLDDAIAYLKKATSTFKAMNQPSFAAWVDRVLDDLGSVSPTSTTDLEIWLCPLCGSKFDIQEAELLKKGKIVSCEYCGTSVG
ncbi:MAG: tetratricopeptide repeat protein [Candidatus Thorarchaeota archaeon]